MNKGNQKLNIILKWTYRFICALSLLTLGILMLVKGNALGEQVISVLVTAVIGALTWQGVKTHSEVKNDMEDVKNITK